MPATFPATDHGLTPRQRIALAAATIFSLAAPPVTPAIAQAPQAGEACEYPVFGGAVFAANAMPWTIAAGDFNGDGHLDAAVTDFRGAPDFDGNGVVGLSDLLVLLSAWGPCA